MTEPRMTVEYTPGDQRYDDAIDRYVELVKKGEFGELVYDWTNTREPFQFLYRRGPHGPRIGCPSMVRFRRDQEARLPDAALEELQQDGVLVDMEQLPYDTKIQERLRASPRAIFERFAAYQQACDAFHDGANAEVIDFEANRPQRFLKSELESLS